jgi:hypothetical protein
MLSTSSALYEDSRFSQNVNQYPQFYKVLHIVRLPNISGVALKQETYKTVRFYIRMSFEIVWDTKVLWLEVSKLPFSDQ